MTRLQQIFSDSWGMRRHDFEATMSLLLPSVIGGNPSGAEELLRNSKCSAMATTLPYVAKWHDVDDTDIPDGSVAVVKLEGTLYSWESEWFAEVVKRADENPKIVGLVVSIDGPGGMLSHLDAAVAALEAFSKPSATVVTGLMASAHFWIGTTTDRTFAVSPLCSVGCVGVVIPYCSFAEYFKMSGIDYREIYPDTADLKNRETRDIEEKDDESRVKARAERLHSLFSESVARHLGIDLDPKLPLFRGEMFPADEAVKLGYIDQMGDLEEALRWVVAQSALRNIDPISAN